VLNKITHQYDKFDPLLDTLMDYVNRINKILKPSIDPDLPKVVDLFAGAGGLSLGFEAAGFKTIGYEMNPTFCKTYKNNLDGNCINLELNKDSEVVDSDIIIGSPPCQPFSEVGKGKGLADSRDGFPIFISIVKKNKPLIWMFENVPGMMHEKNIKYLIEIREALEKEYKIYPILRRSEIINCADFGVPQNRKRIFVIGYRKGLYKFPKKPHPIPKLHLTVGEALEDLLVNEDQTYKYLNKKQEEYIKSYEIKCELKNSRDLYFDRPSRTLTTRNISGATADMLRIKLPDDRRRMLTHSEAARLQSFPDWFEFSGSQTEISTQIGNAVPPLLAYYIGQSFRNYLSTLEKEMPTITHQSRLQVST